MLAVAKVSTAKGTCSKGAQRSAARQSRRCQPLVQLLDQLGVSRSEAHRGVLDSAKARLLALVPRLPPDALVALLGACFAYVGLPELREVPLAVLGQLRPVPATFLKQLATDRELFADLPPAVQREARSLCQRLQDAQGRACRSCRRCRWRCWASCNLDLLWVCYCRVGL